MDLSPIKSRYIESVSADLPNILELTKNSRFWKYVQFYENTNCIIHYTRVFKQSPLIDVDRYARTIWVVWSEKRNLHPTVILEYNIEVGSSDTASNKRSLYSA